MTENKALILERIRREILSRSRFVISSHARPDGDSIGSQLAMAFALIALGKDVHLINRDPAPGQLASFPGVAGIEIGARVHGAFDAAIIMECSDLARTGVEGLDRYFVINIDHHPGNAEYGAINWFDGSAAACGEMVFDIVKAIGVPLTNEIATHVYLALLTDTGSFHYSHITPRTFDICRQVVEAGVDPEAMARRVFDTNTLGRLRLLSAVLGLMQIESSGRVATLIVDRAIAQTAGATYDDTEGLVNLPLTVKEIQAVAFFKALEPGEYRLSLRSKGDVDVAAVAKEFGGGGHRNASGCTLRGSFEELRRTIAARLERAVDVAALDPVR